MRMNEMPSRIETRFPDPASNPYLAMAAILMAGIDGIQNKIHPGDPRNRSLSCAQRISNSDDVYFARGVARCARSGSRLLEKGRGL